mgnify:CR=1 FL=1
MEQAWDVINGWLAYLMRWPVLLQILIVLGPALGTIALSHWLRAGSWLRRYHLIVSLGLMGCGISVMALLRARTGLAIFLGLIYGLWVLIDVLHDWLNTKIESTLVDKIDTEVLRPSLLLVATFLLINKVSNPQQLAAIALGSWFGSTLTVGQVVTVLITLYLLISCSLPAAILLSMLLGRLLNLSDGSRRALSLMLRYSMVGVGLLWALDFTGFNRTAILAIAGGLSVGLGFGIKEIFANFISGLWLLIEGSVRPGEVLFIDDEACEVRRLGLRAALLWRDRDNTELLIPNQIFLTTTTTTFTRTDGMRRCQVDVSAAYKHRPVDVMALIVQATSSVPKVLHQPSPVALVLNYGDSAVQFAVRFWIANPMDGASISSDVRLAIWQTFHDNGIEIPYPQLVLHRD